jgi:hypothetical protein
MSNSNNNSEDLQNDSNTSMSDTGHEAKQEHSFFDSLLSGIDTAFPLSGGEPDIPMIELDEPEEEVKQSMLDSFLSSLNTSFPLSGGEPDIEFVEFEAPEIDLSIEDTQNEQTSTDSSFPLSGG